MIQNVAIAGEGKMGTDLFYYLLNKGMDLVWLCSSEADIEKLSKTFLKKLNRSREAGLIEKDTFDQKVATTVITRDLTLLDKADLVIEALPEEIELKRKLFIDLDPVVKPGCILASNSSSILPSRLIPSESRGQAMVGMHFFYPVVLKNIVELIKAPVTSEETIAAAEKFFADIGRDFITLDEKNGFILNRIFLDFQNELFLIAKEGHITYKEADDLVRENFFPFGVFDFMDSVGLDTMLNSIRNYTADYPHRNLYQPLMDELGNLVSQGHTGTRSGHGFFHYSREGSGQSSPGSLIRDPEKNKEITEHLRGTYLSASRRMTARSGLTIEEANNAIREYFGIEKGPFEQ